MCAAIPRLLLLLAPVMAAVGMARAQVAPAGPSSATPGNALASAFGDSLPVPLVPVAAPMPTDSTPHAAPRVPAREISLPKLAIVGGVTVGGFVAGYLFQENLWWKGASVPFHFEWEHDWAYALGADKYGHFFFPYLATSVYAQAFAWCGVDTGAGLWAAAGLAMAHQTFVEIRDGFSAEWGFSWGDMIANTVGAGLPVARYYLPGLRLVNPKMSFYPSARFRAGSNRAIIDDYESAYHWISVDVRTLLPAAWREDCPAWLAVAIGHGVKGLDDRGGGYHEIFLSLDWNLEGLPGDWWLWRLLKKNLNFYHLPAPAIRILPGVIWYGLKF